MSENKDTPDVCIIGAGLVGGLMAYGLASRGVKVVVLEAGPRHDPRARFSYMQEHLYKGKDPWASNLPARDVYTNAGEIKYPMDGARVKAVGGSTLAWGARALRLHETDFKMKSLYGLGEDWPISYKELEPYYGKAEVALGVAGIADNPFASYRSTPFPLPPFPFSYGDKIMKRAFDKLGIVLHHAPSARNSIPYQGRPACVGFSTCDSDYIRVCPISAVYTAETHIRWAEKTGNARIIPDANVLRINTDKSRKAISVTYAKSDKREDEQRARVFILAAHAVESARLLLLSESNQFPDGLANSSGMVGKTFMEHPYVRVIGKLREKVFPYRIGFDTLESLQFCDSDKRGKMGAFKIGVNTCSAAPRPVELALRSNHWGARLEEEIRDSFGRDAMISAEIEQLPEEKNSITLDPLVKDYFGNPAPRITFSVGQYERETAKTAVALIEKIFDALQPTEIIQAGSDAIKEMGLGAHHMGTCRMGDDPNRFVVDRNLRAHDVNNLFIVGSSAFVTGGVVNPSLTIAALAIRASDYLSSKFR